MSIFFLFCITSLKKNYHYLTSLSVYLVPKYFGHLKRRVDWLEKTLMLGGTGSRRRRGRQRMRWLDGITDSIDMTLCWWWTGRPGVLRFMGLQRVGHDWATELKCIFSCVLSIYWRSRPIFYWWSNASNAYNNTNFLNVSKN